MLSKEDKQALIDDTIVYYATHPKRMGMAEDGSCVYDVVGCRHCAIGRIMTESTRQAYGDFVGDLPSLLHYASSRVDQGKDPEVKLTFKSGTVNLHRMSSDDVDFLQAVQEIHDYTLVDIAKDDNKEMQAAILTCLLDRESDPEGHWLKPSPDVRERIRKIPGYERV